MKRFINKIFKQSKNRKLAAGMMLLILISIIFLKISMETAQAACGCVMIGDDSVCTDSITGELCYLSSQEEGIFGGFLEELAVFICGSVYRGKKSSAEGIDLEFEKDGTSYLVSIKSGPNWGNSRQIARMKDDFKRAKRIRGTNTKGIRAVAVNGCCYGKDDNPDKGDYLKFCGQRFWEFISGDENLYTDIIEPLGHKAKEKNEQFQDEYAKVINKFTLEFSKEYCAPDGSILWPKLVRFNSGKNPR